MYVCMYVYKYLITLLEALTAGVPAHAHFDGAPGLD